MENKTIDFRFDDADDMFSRDIPTLEVEEEKQEEVQEEAPVAETTEAVEEETGVTKEQEDKYLRIYDALMFEGQYSEVVSLGKRYSCKFVTRDADTDLQIQRMLDGQSYSTMMSRQSAQMILTLSHSLMEINGKDISESTTNERYNFIKSLPSHLITVVSNEMYKFDLTASEAIQYGVVNF